MSARVSNAAFITLIGGPTALIDAGGFRLLTDPTFDAPGDYKLPYTMLTKTAGPALTAQQVGAVDAVLLSHDQHADNFDHAGKAYAMQAPRLFTTVPARSGSAAVPRAWRRGASRRSPTRAATLCALPQRRRGTARPASSRCPARSSASC